MNVPNWILKLSSVFCKYTFILNLSLPMSPDNIVITLNTCYHYTGSY